MKRQLASDDPVVDEDLKLTKYAEIKGTSGKLPYEVVQQLFDGVGRRAVSSSNGNGHSHSIEHESAQQYFGMSHFSLSTPTISHDYCIKPLKHGGLSMVQSMDLFYPVVDDPYTMGRIACANVLSGLYALGVADVDNMLMMFTMSNKMPEKSREKAITAIFSGFRDCATSAGTSVNGGQTIINPCLSIGGSATAVCLPNDFIVPNAAVVGDVLVLTKPLGCHLAVTMYQWLLNGPVEKWNKMKSAIGETEAQKAYHRAVETMTRLNRQAARLMHKFGAHAASSVGSYGLLQSGTNLARLQRSDVGFVIHNLPILAMMASCQRVGQKEGLLNGNVLQGQTSETSGGLLIVLPRDQAAGFCKEIESVDGHQAWIIGVVEKSAERVCRIIEKPRLIEVPARDRPDSLW